MLDEDYTPMIFHDKKFYPICQVGFHNNEFGVELFCNTLGYQSGVIMEKFLELEEPAIIIGRCMSHDTNLMNCSGGHNTLKIDGGCEGKCCGANQLDRMKVMCFGGEGKVHTCEGRKGNIYF